MEQKRKIGIILGIASILTAITSVIVFYVTRGPNVNVYNQIKIFSILSILGIIFAACSLGMSKIKSIGIIAVIANVFVLGCTFLLLLAMGIGEE